MDLPPTKINADKPHLWKADLLASVDQFNQWFLTFAPEAYRSTRLETTQQVKAALIATDDLRELTVEVLQLSPGCLPTLRMCTAPPLAVDRLIGLSGVGRTLVACMERGKLPQRTKSESLPEQLEAVCHILLKLLDHDIFPWLESGASPTALQRDRASTIVADRLCGAISNPIVRNAQERRQLAAIGAFLEARGYRRKTPQSENPLREMESGTLAFRLNIPVGQKNRINIPVDVVIQPKKSQKRQLPVLIEAKSAGDFANTNKRRKEEATKIRQLQAAYGPSIHYVLFLCGYFGSDYLGYEAAEGIGWVWEHRISDLRKLGL